MDQITPATSNLTVSDNHADANYDPHEIASLLGNYYHLLARMRYIPHSTIKHPPHSPAIDVSLAESLGLEPQVIELLQLLPYVEGRGSEDEFILQGGFEDFRNIRNLRQSRDPDYASPEGGYEEEGGEYVQPCVLPLNQCGNHGSIMYLDTRNGMYCALPPSWFMSRWFIKTLIGIKATSQCNGKPVQAADQPIHTSRNTGRLPAHHLTRSMRIDSTTTQAGMRGICSRILLIV